MADIKDRAHGWIGSQFVGIPAATGQPAPPPAAAGGSWFTQQGLTVSAPQVQGPTASLGAPRQMEGFVQSKLDAGHDTHKYVGGNILQKGGSIDDVLRDPKFAGWTKASGDKITSPQGSVYDLARDSTGKNGQPGANVAQWTYVGGGPKGVRNDGIVGNDPNSANYTKPGGLGYTGGKTGATQNSSSSAGNPSGMAMPTAPTLQTLTAPAAFDYQGIGNLANTPQMAQQSYNPAATPQALSYENLPTPDGYEAQAYQGMTAEQLQSDPSYQFRLKAGADALENSAASRGVLRTGNTAKGLIDYGQGAASQEYAAADQRARATNQMNNATSLGAYQTNAQTGLAYNQNANQNAMNFGQANIQNAFQANQANNQGSNAAIAANNQSALAQHQQGLAAQQQGYQQAAGTYGMNAGNALAFGQANNQSALANYQAQTNAALGVGNLNLGYTQAANSYDLGKGNLALGQGQLAQQGQNLAFNQAGQTYDRNYQATVTDPWNQQAWLANQGNPGAPNTQGYGNAQSNLITDQANARSQGQIAQGDAYANMAGQVGNLANYGLFNRPNRGLPAPGTAGY